MIKIKLILIVDKNYINNNIINKKSFFLKFPFFNNYYRNRFNKKVVNNYIIYLIKITITLNL